jgi:glycosyltransferase involved in cell wall biosynthesis
MNNQLFNISLSVVVPFYNDQEVVEELCLRLKSVLEINFEQFEIIFIDDCSKDQTWDKLISNTKNFKNTTLLKLHKNSGQQNAISAGLDISKGDFIILMDSDLQDRPEDIPILVKALLSNEECQMAISRWITREDSLVKKALSKLFNKLTLKITGIRHHENLGVFRVIKREVLNELSKYNEKTAPPLSLIYWIGFHYVPVDLIRDKRFAGKTGYNLKKMFSLAMSRIFSYSMFPIRLAIYSGIIIACISFIGAIFLIFQKVYGNVVPGWTSIITLILFLFGLNFIFLGIIGEYLGRIFLESKNRPRYHINKKIVRE